MAFSAVSKPPLLAGYSLTTRLHQGKFTDVYRGISQRDQRAVVVKITRDELPADWMLKLLQHDFDIGQRLPDTHFAPYLSLQTFGHRRAIIEADEGFGSLSQHISAAVSPLEVFFPIAIQLAEAVELLHQHQVVHKNIKPGNILIRQSDTGPQVKLIDFSLASETTYHLQQASDLQASPAYLSPEQTGHVNRPVDYRSDFYSLGVVFYELLTGQLPFTAEDDNGLVYCHITQLPTSPQERNGAVPTALANIVLKLLSKDADLRYQSTAGLHADLSEACKQWCSTGEITSFPLAQQDYSPHLQVPHKLYGREKELQTLQQNLHRVCEGHHQTLLVTGCEGVGKSSLIYELQATVMQQQAYFAAGKFEQFNRDMAYSGFRQVLAHLFNRYLREPNQKRQQWRHCLQTTLGSKGQLLLDLVPQAAALIGPQPPAAHLGGGETRERLYWLLQSVLTRLAGESHPLVLFLDDLQWADSASLELLKQIVLKQIPYVLVICTYCDNEIDNNHPLRLALDHITERYDEQSALATTYGISDGGGYRDRRPYTTLTLQPLDLPALRQWVGASLQLPATAKTTTEIAHLLYQKTLGNPLFAKELLTQLHRDKILQFSPRGGRAEWDKAKLPALHISNNAVDFMARQLQQLPDSTLDHLSVAACLGSALNLSQLARIQQIGVQPLLRQLQPALQQQLLRLTTDPINLLLGTQAQQTDISFFHDHTQQAAYNLLDEAERLRLHLRIGRSLEWAEPTNNPVPPEASTVPENKDSPFELVRHYNYVHRHCPSLIDYSGEREQLLHYNVFAAQQARASAAIETALGYCEVALSLLPPDSLRTHYTLRRDLKRLYTDCLFIAGDFTHADQHIEQLLPELKTALEKAKLLNRRIVQYTHTQQLPQAITTGLQALSLLGMRLPEKPNLKQSWLETLRMQWTLKRRVIHNLSDLPLLSDERIALCLEILANMMPALIMVGQKRLLKLCNTHAIYLSLRFGHTPASSYHYACYALLLDEELNHTLQLKDTFANLAIRLLETIPGSTWRSSTYFLIGLVFAYCESRGKAIEYFDKAISTSRDSGDNFHLAHACSFRSCCELNKHLVAQLQRCKQYFAMMAPTRNCDTMNFIAIHNQACEYLHDPKTFCAAPGDDPIKNNPLAERLKTDTNAITASFYHSNQLRLHWLFGQPEAALHDCQMLAANRSKAMTNFALIEGKIYDFLVRAWHWPTLSGNKKRVAWRYLQRQYHWIKRWAFYAPTNYLHYQHLFEAELARLKGRTEKALHSYYASIEAARQQGYLEYEALANECTGRLLLARKDYKRASTYLTTACHVYQSWGANGKVRQMEEVYANYLLGVDEGGAPNEGLSFSHSTCTRATALDAATVLRATRALAGTMELQPVLHRLLTIAIENAGAQTGSLLLTTAQERELFLELQLPNDQDCAPTPQHRPLSSVGLAQPCTLIRLVARRQEALVFDDVRQSAAFVQDPYIKKHAPKSVACLPLLYQSELLGVVYLENNLQVGAFTEQQQQLLSVLSTQAAIVLKNAQLYHDLKQQNSALEQQVKQCTQALQQPTAAIQQTGNLSDLG